MALTGFADRGAHPRVANRITFDRFIAGQPTEQIEKMNSLIAHLPAGNLDIVDWRRLRTAARELNDLNLADFASVDRLLHRRMIGIESAVQTQDHWESRRPNCFHHFTPCLIINTRLPVCVEM